jgi:hypothetical protein
MRALSTEGWGQILGLREIERLILEFAEALSALALPKTVQQCGGTDVRLN